jgi:GNAT superfamily N-acetyltransferase
MGLILRVCGHRELERIWSLFDLDFDKKELLPKLGVHQAMLKGDMELLAVTEDESRIDLAYVLVGCRGLYGYVWLKYLDVIPFYREKGLGVQAMRLLNKRFADRQGIVAEITDFNAEGGEGETLRAQRKFFARFGYEEIQSDLRIGGVEDHILVKPIRGTAEIAPVAHRMIADFYSRCLRPVIFAKMVDIRPLKKEE